MIDAEFIIGVNVSCMSPPIALFEVDAVNLFGKKHSSDFTGDGPTNEPKRNVSRPWKNTDEDGLQRWRPESEKKGTMPSTFRIARVLNTINDPTKLAVETYVVGDMVLCPYCAARLFPGELNQQQGAKGRYGICCQNGEIEFPKRKAAPPEIQNLLKGTGSPKETELYRTQSRQYNMPLAMASFSYHNATLPTVLSDFRVQGQTFVRFGGIKPATDSGAKIFQVLLNLLEHVNL